MQISIIVPVFNAANTLKNCIDSILMQGVWNYELLLIDDGSKDSSPTICDEYAQKDNRVKVFHKENGGVSAARNLGLDHAKGEWITFIDADDYITKDYFDGIVDHSEDILIKGYRKFDHSGLVDKRETEELLRLSDFPDFLSQYATDSLLRAPWAKFYKRSLIDNLRFLMDMKIGEDAWFVFKYLTKCKSFAVIPQGEYMVRLADDPDEVKYTVSVNYAVNSLNYLKSAFEGLAQTHGISRDIFLHYIGYFKRISKGDWQADKTKWYGNSNVKVLYDYVWPALSFKQRLRLMVAKMLKR